MERILPKQCESFIKLIFLLWIVILSGCEESGKNDQTTDWHNEIIYHVMPRSFYDSNGDLHGDLNGLREKLDYLEELGVTTILLTPLYESGFYHNYFPADYEKIDPEYGTMEDYIRFVKAVHQKGMKFLMDMETQYAQSGADAAFNFPLRFALAGEEGTHDMYASGDKSGVITDPDRSSVYPARYMNGVLMRTISRCGKHFHGMPILKNRG